MAAPTNRQKELPVLDSKPLKTVDLKISSEVDVKTVEKTYTTLLSMGKEKLPASMFRPYSLGKAFFKEIFEELGFHEHEKELFELSLGTLHQSTAVTTFVKEVNKLDHDLMQAPPEIQSSILGDSTNKVQNIYENILREKLKNVQPKDLVAKQLTPKKYELAKQQLAKFMYFLEPNHISAKDLMLVFSSNKEYNNPYIQQAFITTMLSHMEVFQRVAEEANLSPQALWKQLNEENNFKTHLDQTKKINKTIVDAFEEKLSLLAEKAPPQDVNKPTDNPKEKRVKALEKILKTFNSGLDKLKNEKTTKTIKAFNLASFLYNILDEVYNFIYPKKQAQKKYKILSEEEKQYLKEITQTFFEAIKLAPESLQGPLKETIDKVLALGENVTQNKKEIKQKLEVINEQLTSMKKNILLDEIQGVIDVVQSSKPDNHEAQTLKLESFKDLLDNPEKNLDDISHIFKHVLPEVILQTDLKNIEILKKSFNSSNVVTHELEHALKTSLETFQQPGVSTRDVLSIIKNYQSYVSTKESLLTHKVADIYQAIINNFIDKQIHEGKSFQKTLDIITKTRSHLPQEIQSHLPDHNEELIQEIYFSHAKKQQESLQLKTLIDNLSNLMKNTPDLAKNKIKIQARNIGHNIMRKIYKDEKGTRSLAQGKYLNNKKIRRLLMSVDNLNSDVKKDIESLLDTSAENAHKGAQLRLKKELTQHNFKDLMLNLTTHKSPQPIPSQKIPHSSKKSTPKVVKKRFPYPSLNPFTKSNKKSKKS
ncbi:MAG TPA: hypothetical protein QF353_04785 [Gammaproteobacteria bacterium]|nr:hypothetical protein [Gammaproteobacteria bacterium]